jgi:hypothetical protein
LLATLLSTVLAASNALGASGIVAISAETFHQHPDPLVAFSSGRTVSLVPYMGALVRHAADDDPAKAGGPPLDATPTWGENAR